nr:bHLH52 [Pinus massoniana]
MQTFCNSSPAADGQSWNRLPSSITADKRNHKMIERQRRKEMKVLFSQLRSLLPEENLRGKRTVSEQVLEAVNYVYHLQRKVEGLSSQRETMKVNSDQNAKVSLEKFCNETPQFVGSDGECPAVKINSAGSAVQILTNALENEIAYSDILFALEHSEPEIVNAASSAINNKVYHTIHAKVLNLNTFNIHTLYHKLWHLISTQHIKNHHLTVTEDREYPLVRYK